MYFPLDPINSSTNIWANLEPLLYLLAPTMYLHLFNGLLARYCPCFLCPAWGFQANLDVYTWFGIYLVIFVDWFLSCLLLVSFCSRSWCLVEIDIWDIHKFFGRLMMGIDMLVADLCKDIPYCEVWTTLCLKNWYYVAVLFCCMHISVWWNACE